MRIVVDPDDLASAARAWAAAADLPPSRLPELAPARPWEPDVAAAADALAVAVSHAVAEAAEAAASVQRSLLVAAQAYRDADRPFRS